MAGRDLDKSRKGAAEAFEKQRDDNQKRADYFDSQGRAKEAEKARAIADNAKRIADLARANIGKKK